MSKNWTADELLAMTRAYQPGAVLMAAAELELFDRVGHQPFTVDRAVAATGADRRAMTVLLDALAALQLLDKQNSLYQVPASLADALSSCGRHSVLGMVQHQANCARRWLQLAQVVKTGRPAPPTPSIRGEQADHASFIQAMDNTSAPVASKILAEIALPQFKSVLDVGGASGTWTIALLRLRPQATAIIFDMPQVIPMAQQRINDAGFGDRVDFVGGDFYADALPGGADLAWVSAIVHQNSRQQNRDLFAKVREALACGGHVLIRDVIMDESRTTPVAGALFAVNMLTGTARGGTFTLEELTLDLQHEGFTEVRLLRRDESMNSIVQARKPA